MLKFLLTSCLFFSIEQNIFSHERSRSQSLNDLEPGVVCREVLDMFGIQLKDLRQQVMALRQCSVMQERRIEGQERCIKRQGQVIRNLQEEQTGYIPDEGFYDKPSDDSRCKSPFKRCKKYATIVKEDTKKRMGEKSEDLSDSESETDSDY